MALEMFPPLLLVSIRFLISGGIMLSVLLWRGAKLPRGRNFWISASTGIVVLGVGNGCLTFAELWIPSGLAALFITMTPFWFVGLDSLLPGGERLHGPTLAAMLVGFVGAGMLVAPDLLGQSAGGLVLRGFLVLQLGCFAWAGGSLVQRRGSDANPIVTGAVQQLAAGLAFLPFALLIPHGPVQFSWRGVGAILYLVTFGSIVGYTAFVYALQHLPVALVSIYSYINPVVAVILGWIFYREPFGSREATAMATIFLGVALVKRFSRKPAPRQESPQVQTQPASRSSSSG
jgi:drug/metabolite transporter (DMT)-like permease